MRALIIAALLMAVTSAASSPTSRGHEELFAQFKTRYNRKYETPEEEARRLSIFSRNMNRAAELSRKNPQASFGVTKFSDISPEEFARRHGLKKPDSIETENSRKSSLSVGAMAPTPQCTYIDWREKGVVTPVKNQADCGGCWSFSATGAIEGQWALAGHPLTSLSEQELLSCDTEDLGCGGGWVDDTIHWLLVNKSGQIATSKAYPFEAADGQSIACPKDMSKIEVGATIVGWRNLPHDEKAMAAYLCKNGPFSIAVDADDLQTYTGGIMDTCARDDINHAILVVGMDLTFNNATAAYWIIKNQWGTDWGEKGYVRVAYGRDNCGITTDPMNPIV